MSGGEGRPSDLRARHGVLKHHRQSNGPRWMRLHWHCDRHKKHLKRLRKISGSQTNKYSREIG